MITGGWLVSSTVPSSSRSAFAIVLRYTVTVAGASPQAVAVDLIIR
jgi:hypothetical protein